jgi:hypothetical protein
MPSTARLDIIRETVHAAIFAICGAVPPACFEVPRIRVRLRRVAVGDIAAFEAVLIGGITIARRGEGGGRDEQG